MYRKYLGQRSGASMSESFELIFTGKANNVVPVQKYKSSKTGLTVCIAQVEGPLVNGYFCLATEAFDDDGLPHTLEHLVFMGSKKYPYKGVLDLIANRCLASGTNAWTDTDHTCYTMTNAGDEGFLKLLPVYMDHVLYPTLTEAGYITEVHHINGEGDDAGVVYCEMQARENTGESRSHLEMLREMYPGHCGYKSETGGMLRELRESCSHQKVMDYHQEFYRPENLCLIITGQVEPEQVFAALKDFEDQCVNKLPEYKRPWQGAVPPLEGSVDKVVKYSADEEDHGMVNIAWRGPLAKDQKTMSAVMILMEYLTDTAVAPLQRDFVELDDPYCSRVYYSIIENSESCVYVGFKNVPTAKLQQIKPRLFESLKKIGDGTEKFDMDRMKSVVHRRILEAMNNLEDEPHDTLAFMIIGDFLYGNTSEDLEIRLNQIAEYKSLMEKPDSFWLQLINQYFVGSKSVTIVGEPSKVLMKESGETEKERVKQQAASLGESGLKEKADKLQLATENNEIECPVEMLTQVSVPSVTSIKFHSIKPSSNHDQSSANNNNRFPLADIPVVFQLDDIQTNFASLSVLMDTGNVATDLRMLLPLYTKVLLESAVQRNGKLMGYEDIITELAADTLDNNAGLGIGGRTFSCGKFAQVAYLNLKVEREKYTRGVEWVKELLYQVQFTTERLKIVANKMINDVSQMKRNGRFVTQTLLNSMIFNKDSNQRINSMLKQHKFLTGLVEKLENAEQAKEVIEKMNKLRDELTKPSNLRIHVSCHADTLAQDGPPHTPWRQQLADKDTSLPNIQAVKTDHAELMAEGDVAGKGFIVGVGSVESSFLIQVGPGVTSFTHPDLAAIMVYIQYLTQLEGPMWRQIRGLGLSYHYSMYVKPESGLLYFILFKSTHIVNAYKQGKDIVDGYLTGKTPFSEVEFETCKSSLIFEIIEEEKTPSDASRQSMLSYFRGISPQHNQELLKKIADVTLADLQRVGAQYIAPLFDTSRTQVALCCHPTKVDEVVTGFKEFGRELTVIGDMDTSFMAE